MQPGNRIKPEKNREKVLLAPCFSPDFRGLKAARQDYTSDSSGKTGCAPSEIGRFDRQGTSSNIRHMGLTTLGNSDKCLTEMASRKQVRPADRPGRPDGGCLPSPYESSKIFCCNPLRLLPEYDPHNRNCPGTTSAHHFHDLPESQPSQASRDHRLSRPNRRVTMRVPLDY